MKGFSFDTSVLDALVNAEIDRELTEFGVMRLQELIDALSGASDDDTVVYDFCYLAPTPPVSYRGYYDQLAFGYQGDKQEYAVVLRGWAQDAIGNTFSGYKGGRYTMTANTPLWVDNRGEASGTAIVGVKKLSWGRYVICTAHIDG